MRLTKREALTLLIEAPSREQPKKFATWAEYEKYKNRLED